MSAVGYTPIQLYYSTTASAAPSAGNLANGELALNITDGRLFYKDNGGVVQVLATKGSAVVGGATTQVQYNNAGTLAGSANMTFDGTTLTAAGLAGPHNGTVGATTPNTGAFTTLSASSTVSGAGFSTYLASPPAIGGTAANTGAFTTLAASGAVTLSGGTANGVAYLNGSKVLTTGSALTFNGTSFGVPNIDLNNGGILNLYSTGFGSYFQLTNNANALTFGYNGSEVARMTSGGLVVGSTTVPTVGSTAMLAVGNANGGTQAIVQSGSIVYRTSASTSGVDFYNPNASPMQWYTSGTGVLTLSAVGRLTSTANNTDNILTLTSSAGAFSSRIDMLSSSGGGSFINASQYLGFLTGGSEKGRFDSSGNLLVGGTTTPYSASNRGYININGVSSSLLGLSVNGVAAGYFYSTGTNLYVGAPTGYNILFDINGEKARIDSSGNLLVGNASAGGAKVNILGNGGTIGLSVNPNASAKTSIEMITLANDTSTAGMYLYSTVNSAFNFRVWSNGNVQNTNNSYGAISDIKLKENIVDATPKLGKLQQVRVVNYNLIGEEQKQIGVIAQELEQIFPGMIDESPDRDKDGNDLGTTTKSVKYSVFVPMLIKAIQEQQAIINQLKADVAALKGN